MLVTVIQHLMAIIKSIFLFFFYNETLFWPFEQSLRSSKPKSTLRSHISLCTHLIQTNYLFMCIFWAVRSCMLKGNQRGLYTLVHTDKIKHHSKKKLSIWNFCLVFAPLLIYFFFKCLLKQRNKRFTVFFYFSHSLDAIKLGVVQKLLLVS